MNSIIQKAFFDLFEKKPLIAFAPGRINLIGEHTDYQEGFVFPAAVKQGIWVGIQKNHISSCRLFSLDFQEEFTFDPASFSPKRGHWANYVMGFLSQLKQAGYEPTGFDMVIGGDIPVGAGLSSSAALSVAIGTALSGLFELSLSKKSIALYSQKSEHLFAGVNCGIMDPYASAFGVKDKALLLDCKSNTHKEISVNLGNYNLLLVNSKVKHSLADSAYNKRREACEESVRTLQKSFPDIKTLRDISTDQLKEVASLLPSGLFPKARHVITENHRVRMAAAALQEGQLEEFGTLLRASHVSLSQDYDVSCPELDFLADFAWEYPALLGSRMMGGGFGGCTINLISKEREEDFKNQLSNAYRKKFGITPDFISVELADGAVLLS